VFLKIRKLTKIEILRYINNLELKKIQTSGLYQIEDVGITLFEKIKGSYFTILGLPLLPLLNFLKKKKILI
jgi:septum formation protein